MNARTFNQKDYNECDQIGKEKAIEFFKQFDYELISDEEVYIYDLLMKDHFGKTWKIEVEQKRVWITQEFIFESIHIPKRKNKNRANIFILFNNSWNALLFMEMKEIKKSPIKRKNTKTTIKEEFFEIPLNEALVFYLCNGKWLRDYKAIREMRNDVRKA